MSDPVDDIADGYMIFVGDYDCPDCLVDIQLKQLEPGIWNVTVWHDWTCPTYLAQRS